MSLVAFGFFCCPTSKESPSPLAFKELVVSLLLRLMLIRSKGEGDSFNMGQQKKPEITSATLSPKAKMLPQ